MTMIDDGTDRCASAGCEKKNIQRILVLQQGHRAESKIEGIREYGQGNFQLDVVSLAKNLPLVIDDGRQYLPKDIVADMVLDFLTHADLSEDLATICEQQKIPIVASGKKINHPGVYTPPT